MQKNTLFTIVRDFLLAGAMNFFSEANVARMRAKKPDAPGKSSWAAGTTNFAQEVPLDATSDPVADRGNFVTGMILGGVVGGLVGAGVALFGTPQTGKTLRDKVRREANDLRNQMGKGVSDLGANMDSAFKHQSAHAASEFKAS